MRTSVNNVVFMKVVDCVQDLLDGLRGILLGEFALLADAVEQFTADRELCNDIELVLENNRG